MSGTHQLYNPQELYRHWEEQQWNPWSIDLAADRDQWHGTLDEQDKSLVHWALSSLMVAEERITTKPAGLVLAAESEEEASFLASQQVDEARHMQFYARIQDEVIAEPGLIAAHGARSREQLDQPFAVIVDQALVADPDKLIPHPEDRSAKVAFITTYHLVIESVLGLTAFEFITRYLRDNQLLPGFVDGYSHIHHDEQRHIGYGIWYLQNAARAPALPTRSGSLSGNSYPPPRARSPHPTAKAPTGKHSALPAQRSNEFALGGLIRRLNIIGVSLDTL